MIMATMWPRLLPAAIRADSRRAAEIRVYDALAAQLGSGWTVFYSRPWLGETSTGAEIDGESDFIAAHPSHGVLFIEVKGGAITYDPAEERWTSTDRYGIRHRIKNPVKQSADSKHILLQKAQAERGWPRGFFRFRHGVILPDVAAVPQNMGPDKPRELFATRQDLDQLSAWVVQRLSGGNEDPLGPHGMRVLEHLLARPIQLHSPLAYSSEDDDAAIENLTPSSSISSMLLRICIASRYLAAPEPAKPCLHARMPAASLRPGSEHYSFADLHSLPIISA